MDRCSSRCKTSQRRDRVREEERASRKKIREEKEARKKMKACGKIEKSRNIVAAKGGKVGLLKQRVLRHIWSD